ASLYRPFFIVNLLRYLAEKILLLNTTDFRGDYREMRENDVVVQSYAFIGANWVGGFVSNPMGQRCHKIP
ncbi:hypothetical protein N5A93_19420, partial [Roseovarius sp. EGI FJ00037]|uniref:hypothetical protein n=1 Tax=Roseovarius salincola TaxID=2978479 RepID=UPI0022A81E05